MTKRFRGVLKMLLHTTLCYNVINVSRQDFYIFLRYLHIPNLEMKTRAFKFVVLCMRYFFTQHNIVNLKADAHVSKRLLQKF